MAARETSLAGSVGVDDVARTLGGRCRLTGVAELAAHELAVAARKHQHLHAEELGRRVGTTTRDRVAGLLTHGDDDTCDRRIGTTLRRPRVAGPAAPRG